MTVTPGIDFAMAEKTTWIFSSGVATSTAVATSDKLFIFPHKAIGSNNKTTYTIGGKAPLDAITGLVKNPETTVEELDSTMEKWSSDVEGPLVFSLSDFQRVRIFTGWIRRSVAFTKKAKGMDFSATSVRPSKAELSDWVNILKDHPSVEMK